MRMLLKEQTTLAVAVAEFIEPLHQRFSGLRIHPISLYEDEDFALEVLVPQDKDIEAVDQVCHEECIAIEDRYGVYLLVRATRAET